MDPVANLRRQRELASELQRVADCVGDDQAWTPDPASVYELCELVEALDDWMLKGGFNPWAAENPGRVTWHQELA